ncbi:MAG: FMN-binding protein, partial [Clostridia bacterium]|nr:FMN-binding protein [Clostridia bacterium]
ENVDAIGGATGSSKAAVEAVNKALGLEAAEAPAAEEAAPAAPAVLTGTAQGYKGEVTATVTVDENGVVTAVEITGADATEAFNPSLLGNADFAAQFVGKTGPFVLDENVDAIGGATGSSKAAVEAVNNALK